MVFTFLKAAFDGAISPGRDRRTLPRLEEGEATLVLADISYRLLDWNPNGFQIETGVDHLSIGDTPRARLIIPYKGISYGFDMYAEIVRVDVAARTAGGMFIDVDAGTLQRLRRLYTDRMK